MVATEPPGAVVTTTLETKESRKARKSNPDLKAKTYGCSPTPCEIELPRRSKFIAKIEKPGFEPVRATILSKAGKKGKVAGSAAPAAVTIIAGSEIAAASTATSFFLLEAYTIAGATTGAVMIGVPLGFADAVSGAMLDLYPNPIGVKLTPKSGAVDKDKIKTQLTDLK